MAAGAPSGRSGVCENRRMAARWKSREFLLRLALAYVIVPPSAPVLLIAWTLLGQAVRPADAAGIVLIYSFFSLAAMLAGGLPLLALYLWRGWTGYLAFAGGAAACAAATYLLVAGPMQHQLWLFTLFGVVEGLLFRVVLFGFGRRVEG